jgi:hypothetical protein
LPSFLEWYTFVKLWEKNLMAMLGVKDRTARGYAVVMAALKFIYDNNEQHFIDLGHPWTEFLEV